MLDFLFNKKEIFYTPNMQEVKEISVILKDSEKRIKHDFLIYDEVILSSTHPVIQNCIAEAKSSFRGEPESIKIKATLEVL